MSETKAEEGHVILVLDNGYRIESWGDGHEAGAEVTVFDAEGNEVVHYECREWEDEPELVMGAILRAAAGV